MSAPSTVQSPKAADFVNLAPGEPAPWFDQRSLSNPRYVFDTAGGRYIVLCFFGSAGQPAARAALDAVAANGALFDDDKLAFFGVTIDRSDESEGRLREVVPGRRYFLDFDHKISRLYGAVPRDGDGSQKVSFRSFWVVLDPTMRIMEILPLTADGSERERLFSLLAELPPVDRFAGVTLQAPVLYLPNVFEPALCRRLIGLYEEHGGRETGFMRQVDGRTVGMLDPSHKRRKDYDILDDGLRRTLQGRILRRVVPEIAKVHQFHVTRMERYIVSCYAAEDGGHFRAHRDNTTTGTAHRRFAVSINLNADFEGGEVGFPEYGSRTFKAPAGGAVVFSCSLLHAVSRVTAGRRYAFLPFLYDDEAAALREKNEQYVTRP